MSQAQGHHRYVKDPGTQASGFGPALAKAKNLPTPASLRRLCCDRNQAAGTAINGLSSRKASRTKLHRACTEAAKWADRIDCYQEIPGQFKNPNLTRERELDEPFSTRSHRKLGQGRWRVLRATRHHMAPTVRGGTGRCDGFRLNLVICYSQPNMCLHATFELMHIVSSALDFATQFTRRTAHQPAKPLLEIASLTWCLCGQSRLKAYNHTLRHVLMYKCSRSYVYVPHSYD